MDMAAYFTEIEHAARAVHRTIWEEHELVEAVQKQIAPLQKRVEDDYRRAESWKEDALDADDVMMGVGLHWETYFGPDKKLYELDKKQEALNDQLAAHAFSRSSLAGSLIQYAKQGISLVHGGLGACPAGRVVCAAQSLKTVIWQARNNALHWEDGTPHPPVVACFNALTGHDAKFGSYATRNMAFETVDLLGWRDFDRFKQDLMSLA